MLYYAMLPGVCPAANGGPHDPTDSFEYMMYHDLPDHIDYKRDFTFPDGTAAGGWAQVTLKADGSYVFSGHMHDSGAIQYKISVSFVVVDTLTTAWTFATEGEVNGTFESGSRDWDWSITGVNPQIADNWTMFSYGDVHWSASTTVDLSGLTDELVKAAGEVLQVVSIVLKAAGGSSGQGGSDTDTGDN